MLDRGPNFSPYPWSALPRVSRAEAAAITGVAQWIAARPLGGKVRELVGCDVAVRVVGTRAAPVGTSDVHVNVTRARARARDDEHDAARDSHGAHDSHGARDSHGAHDARGAFDPHAAVADVRIDGAAFVLAASSRSIRALAQRVLGGPAELDAPRPLTVTEHAIWALAIAAAIDDAGIAAEVWPLERTDSARGFEIELLVDARDPAQRGDAHGVLPMTVVARCPPELAVRVPPVRPVPAWTFELPVVVARTVLPRDAVRALAVRDVITVEAGLELVVGQGAFALRPRGRDNSARDVRGALGVVEAVVASEYRGRDMAVPDQAHLDVTVQLGVTRLTLRQLAELAVGQIVPLGRPLAGPFEIRAAGRVIGQGELVDIDGELGVRIVSLATAEE